MPKWLKVVLIVGGVLVVLAGLCIGGGVFWFQANKGQLKAMGDKAKDEGAAFGRQTDEAGCLNEALKRLDAIDGMLAEVSVKLFLEACLEAAGSTAGFCDGVPPKGEIMKSATWAIQVCNARASRDPQACGRLVQAVQDKCAKAK